jgi:DNA-binding LacI/PurR family transcriptional regulator
MGSVAVDLSLSMLQDETTASQSILLDVDLVIRESA